MKLEMKRKVLIFGLIASMSVFGMTRLVAADYHGNVPSERLLAQASCFDWITWEDDTDCDGEGDSADKCVNLPGDEEHCGCPEHLVDSDCNYLKDPNDPNNMNDSEGVPVGGGLLLLLGSALVYGATLRRRNNTLNLEDNN